MGRTTTTATTTTTTATATATATRRSTRLAIKVEDKTQDAATAPPKALTKTTAKAKAKTASTSTAKAAPKAVVKKAGKAGQAAAGQAAGKTAGKTAGKELAKTTRTKKVGKEPAVPKATKAKKQTPPEPAASRQRKRKQDQIDTAADDAPVVKPTKRPRKSKNAKAVALKQENHDVEMASTTASPRPRNRTDPCEMLPTEVWHQVLSLLPLSQAATSSLVSKTWLDGARAWPIWKQICEASKLGKPKRKYKTYMSLVCAQSYFICDKCHSFSHGIKVFNASGIPLPVDVIVKKAEKPNTEQAQGQAKNKDTSKGTNEDTAKDDKGNNKAVEKDKEQHEDQKPQDQRQSYADPTADDQASGDIVERWNLCHDCRTAYYLDYPEEYRRLPGESEDDWEHRRSDRITKTRACSTYYLTEEDLAGLDYREVRNPHHRSWYPMRLFDRHDIQDRALDIHGGWVGVDACTKGIARARRLACKLRDAAVLGDSTQPRKKRVMKEDPTQGASQSTSQESVQGASQEASQGLGSTQVQLLEVKQELATQLANGAAFTTSGMTPMSAMPTMPTMPVVAAGAQ
ncbi:hypothetical protein KVV02_002274 [Mortierella alpina]|uniref:F-box domain-containing protein n=1 Tax=Mortierella alpina TaxID=64518 RepID=A0A9P8A5R4_MORAP|nr:hypothetical protein KVV02_002274 [Mortierella alpina]